MNDITPQLLELIRLAATNLPPDVDEALRAALETEESGSADLRNRQPRGGCQCTDHNEKNLW